MNQMILIWFRRFRPDYGKKFRFHTALSQACSCLAHPFTIQDSSYNSNLLGDFLGRGWFILPLTFLALIVGVAISFLLSFMFLPESLIKAGGLIGTLLLFVIGPFLSFKAYRLLGNKPYINQENKHELINKLEYIRAGRIKNITGVDVIQCNDNDWQDIVSTALLKADIAIVDVSEVTENLAWEISQTFKYLPKDRVIFVCEEEANQPALLTNLKQLCTSFDTDVDSDKFWSELIVYPSERASIGPGRNRQMIEFGKLLRINIADRLFRERKVC